MRVAAARATTATILVMVMLKIRLLSMLVAIRLIKPDTRLIKAKSAKIFYEIDSPSLIITAVPTSTRS